MINMSSRTPIPPGHPRSDETGHRWCQGRAGPKGPSGRSTGRDVMATHVGTWWENDGNMGKWWEHDGNMGKWWENDGKMMGTWWENDGNMMGTWWEHDGNMGKWWENDGKMMGKWWEHMGKWWENDGNIWENDGKMMGKWWENDGKMMGKWENDGKMMADMENHGKHIGWHHGPAMRSARGWLLSSVCSLEHDETSGFRESMVFRLAYFEQTHKMVDIKFDMWFFLNVQGWEVLKYSNLQSTLCQPCVWCPFLIFDGEEPLDSGVILEKPIDGWSI